MFYAHIILAKKGPLARVWLAAHWDKKITKAHVFETNIEKSVEGIMQPKVKLALRTSGHLLLGVVRIHSRKAKYLLADCNEAFVKIKMAFRPGMVDLPEDHREANINAITLPEVFHDFDTELPELNDIDIEAQFSINQSRADEITMREDYGSLSISLHDDGFGDIGFEGGSPDLIRDDLDPKINDDLFDNDGIVGDINQGGHQTSAIQIDENELPGSHFDEAGYGDGIDQPELFGDNLFGEPPTMQEDPQLKPPVNEMDGDNSDHFGDEPPSPAYSSQNSPRMLHKNKEDNLNNLNADNNYFERDDANRVEQSTLIQNEDESFALAPVDASAYKGLTKAKRKRKLIVDEVKNISGEEMKAQLANTSDIVTTLDLAPPTKRLMYWKETGGVEKLFSLPSRSIPARALYPNYQRHLVSHFAPLENFSSLGPSDLLALDQLQTDNESPVIQNKRGRKRKHEIQALTQPNESLPEQIRQNEDEAAQSRLSLNVEITPGENNTLVNEKSDFGINQSPGHRFAMSTSEGADEVNAFHGMPMTPGNIHQGIDSVDDFNHGDLTPAGLHHGQLSPHHVGLESIESIPNLPVDQISSFFNEAENMPYTTDREENVNQMSEWNSNYLYPVSKTPQEEQLENETSEQFEERVLNKRAAQMFYAVKARMMSQEALLLTDLTHRSTRKMAAQKFYSLLVLKKFGAVNLAQSAPYSEIVITRGACFDNPKL